MSTHSVLRRGRTVVLPPVILGPTENRPSQPHIRDEHAKVEVARIDAAPRTIPSIKSLIEACARVSLSDAVLDRKSILVKALEPAYALLVAAEGDAEAAELVQGRANSGKTKGRKADLALACAQLIVSPGNLKAQKAASEYAAMLRFAEQQKVTVSAFADFATKTPLRDAKAAVSRNKTKKRTAGVRLQLRLCGEEGSSGPSYLEVPADVLPILRQVLTEKNLRWDDFAISLLTRLTSAGDDTEEATDAQG
ncbi:hypothetical protein [Ancylobacter vacuolatus]|uniref:Uncharacterized protein n=1 Tax=Ancylobacter vacuolatus TaxID=223389 RepID=A0ABU0DN07_9HYPH|nr:hypothetical protein [Ancylobacter vacuolatus]MDQ0349816.1 hypothetical protein [Ancylobacter vacuolatus]